MLASLAAADPAAGSCAVPTAAYPTIQSAVDDQACELVDVAAGTFLENVVISHDVTVQGQGPAETTLNGNAAGPVFAIESAGAVALTGLGVTGGEAPNGGGIHATNSLLTIDHVAISGNAADDFGGGIWISSGALTVSHTNLSFNTATSGAGIYSEHGPLTVIRSTVHANAALYGAGGISNNYGALTVSRSTLSHNSGSYAGGIYSYHGPVVVGYSTLIGNLAGSSAGGLYNNSSPVTLNNSTLVGNVAGSYGGGIFNGAGMTVNNSTISANSAFKGGGINTLFAPAVLRNTIVAHNVSGGDCDGELTSEGYNLDSDGTCSLTAVGDLPYTDPLLGPLQDNGGPTWTMALLEGSPAVDAGNPAVPGSGAGACEALDQRGTPRPLDGDGDGAAVCDMGALELDEAIADLLAANDGPAALGATTTLSATIAAGTNVSFTWALGDGTFSAGQVVTHTYADAGAYSAVVTATNLVSTAVATTEVMINPPPPTSYPLFLPTAINRPEGR
jgi:hypothetical protein